jgi:rubrerythrin
MEKSDDLVSVYAAANLVIAHLVKNLLEAEGISARVNEVTEYPAEFHVGPDVWVKQADLARAQAILAQHDRELSAHAAAVDWICPSCGNTVPGSFEECDVCQTLSGRTNPVR